MPRETYYLDGAQLKMRPLRLEQSTRLRMALISIAHETVSIQLSYQYRT